MSDIVFALTGDVRRNSRALKQLRSLATLGVTIDVYTLGAPAATETMEENIRLHFLPRASGSGPGFFARNHRTFREATRSAQARVYHASDLYNLPAMRATARQHGGKLVYDARELYPYVASTAGRPTVRQFWRVVEGYYIRRADAVFTVSESIADQHVAMYGIPRSTVLYNAPPFDSVTPSTALRDLTGVSDDTVVLLHQGQIQKDRGCLLLTDAMRDMRGAVLIFLGGGPLKPALEAHVEKTGLNDRVRFLDPVPPDDLLPVTASADVGITLLEDTCLNHRFALPNKLFEYLMAGLPVLASDLPEIRKVVKGFDVGAVVNPTDREALVKRMQDMADDKQARQRWQANAPRVFETFNWESASQRFIRIYQDLLSSSVHP
ncbi:MAG TPA: glycosyltransferase family 4 protein [Rhodothermales bacterium]|nr:glycosyltransferase family 4 protein [Rhodothermales bacterium]